jgi:4Fe-4S binding domain.
LDIDYDFCKGCGICEKICPKQAIKMEVETHD